MYIGRSEHRAKARHSIRHTLVPVCLAVAHLSAHAQPLPAPPSAPSNPAAACEALRSGPNLLRFSKVEEAPITIFSATLVKAGGDGSVAEKDLPEICRVEGQIAPAVGFLLRLPTKSWNGKFMMGGCGGPCGNYLADRIDPALVRNYAVVNTDMGHKGPGWTWAYNNLAAQIDWGYRATHVTAVAAKEIIKAYYGQPAKKNYFWGCSTGGRQGMISAQRFPADFDGIIAGAPGIPSENPPFFRAWTIRSNIGPDGNSILSQDTLKIAHKAVIAACDGLDNLKDGLLQNPRQCQWKPQQAVCKPGQDAATCLTAQQADVIDKIYTGARNSAGEQMFFGMERGSELTWGALIRYDGETAKYSAASGDNIMNYANFYYAKGPDYSPLTFDYDRDPPALAMQDVILGNVRNPDLRRFKARGGKLIGFTGWNDISNPVGSTIDYYELATRTMGGEQATKDFYRFFILPGAEHCRGGAGAGEVDWITALENWVEKDQAPDQVIAYNYNDYPTVRRVTTTAQSSDGASTYMRTARHPLPAGSYDKSQPVYAYPDVAAYSGRGDPKKPESWTKGRRPR